MRAHSVPHVGTRGLAEVETLDMQVLAALPHEKRRTRRGIPATLLSHIMLLHESLQSPSILFTADTSACATCIILFIHLPDLKHSRSLLLLLIMSILFFIVGSYELCFLDFLIHAPSSQLQPTQNVFHNFIPPKQKVRTPQTIKSKPVAMPVSAARSLMYPGHLLHDILPQLATSFTTPLKLNRIASSKFPACVKD